MFGLARRPIAGLLPTSLVLSPVYAKGTKHQETCAIARLDPQRAYWFARGEDVPSITRAPVRPARSSSRSPAAGLVVPCP